MPGSAVTDLAGRVLAGRYLLHSPIGTGASGRVYVADDIRLRRRVAVKVLHAALAEDGAFLRRFRAEAQLAASLHHPHIVTVHDWGEDDVPFMVLELLEGGSLRAMLDGGVRLSVSQTARIGRDVASALEYAHARSVLHRDIKPANLLFDEHGIVRVADFGLARALAEASWTEPSGAVFGTARYASPEQATGLALDPRSDLYSLALVLVEAATGTVPFASDTTLGTLAARTQRPLTAPESLGPLAPVVDRAGALDRNDRYPDAATMRRAIADAADALPPPGPLPLAGMSDRADPHPTRAVTSGASRLFDQDAVEVVPAPEAGTRPKIVRGQRRLVPFVVAVALLAVVVVAGIALARVGAAASTQVPGVVGRSQAAATAVARQNGFGLTVSATRAAPDPKGTVISQSPESGAWTHGTTVHVVVSAGPPNVAVPTLVGKSWTAAKQVLDQTGFAYDDPPAQAFDNRVPAGQVISVNPAAGTSVSPDAKLTVVVSKGHAPVQVPDVSHQTFADAKSALEAQGFTVPDEVDDFNSDVAKGQVIATAPAAGTLAPYGSQVVVHVSKGPDLVKVPDVRNLTLDEASAALAAQGLQLGDVTGYKPGATVKSSSPGRNQMVLRNTSVNLNFGGGSIINQIFGG